MQLPSEKTPVSKCIDLAQHAGRMLGKFTANAALVDLAVRMQAAGGALLDAQQAYEAAVRAILPTRVDVKYIDFVADRLVQRVQRRAELADDRKGGVIATQVLPKGASAVTRLRGASQVKAMIDLEGDIKAVQSRWPEAVDVLAEVTQHRQQYQTALEGRRAAGQAAHDLRAERNAEKLRFLSTYAEIASLVKAQFPRDKQMQELFFDEVRTRSAGQIAESDDDLPEEEQDREPASAASPA